MKGSENETDEFPFYDHHYKESQENENNGESQRSSISVSNQSCVEKFEDKSSSPNKDIKDIEDIHCDEQTAQETTHPDLEHSDSEENSSCEKQNLEIGDLNCFCSPTRVDGRKDFLNRICLWCYLNKDQFMSALTGRLFDFIFIDSIIIVYYNALLMTHTIFIFLLKYVLRRYPKLSQVQ